jgi:hypothetical protein
MTQEFEGQEISEFIAVIPSMKLEAPDSYQRGTYLTLNVEVRVKSVRYEEVTTGKNKGDLQKVHVLAIENVSVTETITPQQRQAILEAAAAQLLDSDGKPVVVEDGGPSSEAVAGSISEPVYENTSKEEAVARYESALASGLSDAEAREEGWVYESPEYAQTEPASVGF